jgi:dynein heavy chain, axonemal
MADRHWKQIEEATGVKIGDVNDPSFTLQKVCDLNLDKHLEVMRERANKAEKTIASYSTICLALSLSSHTTLLYISHPLTHSYMLYVSTVCMKIKTCEKIAETAAKEYTIEQTLDKMEADWLPFKLDIRNYRDTGTGVLAGFDEINTVLDEQVTMTQAMQFSAFKGPFEERIDVWNHKLFVVSEVLDNWIKVQREWMYLQPIFESEDIIRQLPAEAKKYAHVDKAWRQTISGARKHPEVVEYCDNEKLLLRFREGVKLLDEVQKGLNQYLETKRDVFPRFYFLSNDDLLTILSESKDVKKLQPHFKKVFEATDHVIFDGDLNITSVVSPEKERFELTNGLDPKGHNVESWLYMLEGEMKISIRDIMKAAIADYMCISRIEWMQKWPSMHVLNASQLYWTKETEELFAAHGAAAPQLALDRQKKQLADMVLLVRQPLPKGDKTKVGALAVIDVHARDVMMKLVNAGTETTADFLWQSQLRYYWELEDSENEDGDLWAMMVAARRPYGYEYLGNSFRLVITPLTDKCYLTLMGALQMILGGAPAGPAGTGKTETTKDLSKALAVQCVVFNCSDGLGYLEMGKFAKGLSSCGAWACYDEFNRINIEVLSVVGQQVMEIQLAIKAGLKRIIFMESDIAVKKGFGVFITMNPGYAGRTELPDSLNALFRPVAMMVPDYALIGEIMFFA